MQALDPATDQDGDGQSNAAEHTAATNPLSTASVLSVSASARSGNDVLVTVATVAGKIYQLETSTTLAAGDWDEAGAPVEASGPSTVLTALGGAVDPRRFFRVKVVP